MVDASNQTAAIAFVASFLTASCRAFVKIESLSLRYPLLLAGLFPTKILLEDVCMCVCVCVCSCTCVYPGEWEKMVNTLRSVYCRNLTQGAGDEMDQIAPDLPRSLSTFSSPSIILLGGVSECMISSPGCAL